PGERITDGLAPQRLTEQQVRQRERELLGHRDGESPSSLAEPVLGHGAGERRQGEEAERLPLGRQGNADERRRRSLPEMGAGRARAGVVYPIDPAASESPAVLDLEPLSPVGERRAPGRRGPQAVA